MLRAFVTILALSSLPFAVASACSKDPRTPTQQVGQSAAAELESTLTLQQHAIAAHTDALISALQKGDGETKLAARIAQLATIPPHRPAMPTPLPQQIARPSSCIVDGTHHAC